MKFIGLLIIFLFFSCSQKKEINPFKSKELFETVKNSISSQKKNAFSKRDSIYYLFVHNDSLIIVSLDNEKKFIPIINSQKKGSFKIQNSKVVISNSVSPKYNILEVNDSVTYKKLTIGKNNKFDDDFIKGEIYKITKNQNKFKFTRIYSGSLNNIFLNRKPYKVEKIYE